MKPVGKSDYTNFKNLSTDIYRRTIQTNYIPNEKSTKKKKKKKVSTVEKNSLPPVSRRGKSTRSARKTAGKFKRSEQATRGITADNPHVHVHTVNTWHRVGATQWRCGGTCQAGELLLYTASARNCAKAARGRLLLSFANEVLVGVHAARAHICACVHRLAAHRSYLILSIKETNARHPLLNNIRARVIYVLVRVLAKNLKIRNFPPGRACDNSTTPVPFTRITSSVLLSVRFFSIACVYNLESFQLRATHVLTQRRSLMYYSSRAEWEKKTLEREKIIGPPLQYRCGTQPEYKSAVSSPCSRQSTTPSGL